MESTIHPTHVEVTLTAQDLDDLEMALGVYVGDCEAGYLFSVDPCAGIERARVLSIHLRTIRAALP